MVRPHGRLWRVRAATQLPTALIRYFGSELLGQRASAGYERWPCLHISTSKLKAFFDEGVIRRRHQVAQNLGTLPFKFTVQHG